MTDVGLERSWDQHRVWCPIPTRTLTYPLPPCGFRDRRPELDDCGHSESQFAASTCKAVPNNTAFLISFAFFDKGPNSHPIGLTRDWLGRGLSSVPRIREGRWSLSARDGRARWRMDQPKVDKRSWDPISGRRRPGTPVDGPQRATSLVPRSGDARRSSGCTGTARKPCRSFGRAPTERALRATGHLHVSPKRPRNVTKSAVFTRLSLLKSPQREP